MSFVQELPGRFLKMLAQVARLPPKGGSIVIGNWASGSASRSASGVTVRVDPSRSTPTSAYRPGMGSSSPRSLTGSSSAVSRVPALDS